VETIIDVKNSNGLYKAASRLTPVNPGKNVHLSKNKIFEK